jgi:hypothetical protein
VIEDDFLETYEIDLNHDDLLMNRLMTHAEFFCHDGVYEGIEECAVGFFEGHQDDKPGEGEYLRPLRRAYNDLIQARQVVSFNEEDEEALADEWEKEKALVKELLEFYGDRDVYVILKVNDTVYEVASWFLMEKEALEALGVPLRRGIA